MAYDSSVPKTMENMPDWVAPTYPEIVLAVCERGLPIENTLDSMWQAIEAAVSDLCEDFREEPKAGDMAKAMIILKGIRCGGQVVR